MKTMTHRNIPGEDFTQAAYLPIYVIGAFIWRSNLKKILGFEPPKAAVTFFDPPKYKPEWYIFVKKYFIKTIIKSKSILRI